MVLRKYCFVAANLLILVFAASCGVSDVPSDAERVAVRTTLAAYPVGSEPAILVVNNGSDDVQILRDVLIERETEGQWAVISDKSDEIRSEPRSESMYSLAGYDVYVQSVFFEMGDYVNLEGHYRVTVTEAGGVDSFGCEFLVVSDWDELPLNEKLQRSPFCTTDAELDDIQITVDSNYKLSESGTRTFDYSISNISERTLVCGEECWIEVLLDERWFLAPITGWDAVAYYLEPQDEITLQAYLIARWWNHGAEQSDGFGWEAGEYRLVKTLSDKATGTRARYFVPFEAAEE